MGELTDRSCLQATAPCMLVPQQSTVTVSTTVVVDIAVHSKLVNGVQSYVEGQWRMKAEGCWCITILCF